MSPSGEQVLKCMRLYRTFLIKSVQFYSLASNGFVVISWSHMYLVNLKVSIVFSNLSTIKKFKISSEIQGDSLTLTFYNINIKNIYFWHTMTQNIKSHSKNRDSTYFCLAANFGCSVNHICNNMQYFSFQLWVISL